METWQRAYETNGHAWGTLMWECMQRSIDAIIREWRTFKGIKPSSACAEAFTAAVEGTMVRFPLSSRLVLHGKIIRWDLWDEKAVDQDPDAYDTKDYPVVWDLVRKLSPKARESYVPRIAQALRKWGQTAATAQLQLFKLKQRVIKDLMEEPQISLGGHDLEFVHDMGPDVVYHNRVCWNALLFTESVVLSLVRDGDVYTLTDGTQVADRKWCPTGNEPPDEWRLT